MVRWPKTLRDKANHKLELRPIVIPLGEAVAVPRQRLVENDPKRRTAKRLLIVSDRHDLLFMSIGYYGGLNQG